MLAAPFGCCSLLAITELLGLGGGSALNEERTLVMAFSWVRWCRPDWDELIEECSERWSSIYFVFTRLVTDLFS